MKENYGDSKSGKLNPPPNLIITVDNDPEYFHQHYKIPSAGPFSASRWGRADKIRQYRQSRCPIGDKPFEEGGLKDGPRMKSIGSKGLTKIDVAGPKKVIWRNHLEETPDAARYS